MSSQNGLEAFNWLNSIHFSKFTTIFSPFPRYGILTSNNAESTNSQILKIRNLPILSLCHEIEKLTIAKIAEKRKNCLEFSTIFTPFAHQKFLNSCLNNTAWDIIQDSPTTFYLSKNSGEEENVSFQQNILCSCKMYEQWGIPCFHICFCYQKLGLDAQHIVSDIWMSEYYKAAYEVEGSAQIVMLKDLEKKELFPPLAGTQRGRPRVRRIESQFNKSAATSFRQKCAICKKDSQNSRTCPEKNI